MPSFITNISSHYNDISFITKYRYYYINIFITVTYLPAYCYEYYNRVAQAVQ